MKKALFFTLIVIFSLTLVQTVYAQDEVVAENTVITEEITAEDLGVSEPTILPTNTFGYFFKNLGQAIKSAVTFNKEKKAELQYKYANQKLIEAKIMAEENPADAKVQERITKSHEKYQNLMAKVHEKVEAIKAKGDDRAEDFIDKITKEEFKKQQLMKEIKEKVQNISEDQKVRLEQIKENALEKFGNFIEQVDDNKEKVRERFEKVIEYKEDNLDNLKHLEIMERLGDKFENNNLKEGLIEAKENAREGLIDYLTEQPELAEVERFKLKLNELNSDEAYKLRVMNFVGEGLQAEAKLNFKLNQFNNELNLVKEVDINQFSERLENAETVQVREQLLKPLEAGEMNSVEVLQRVMEKVKNPQAKEAMGKAQVKQTQQFNQRFENINDTDRLEKLRGEIYDRPQIMNRFVKAEPEMFKKVDNRIDYIKDSAKDNKQKNTNFRNRVLGELDKHGQKTFYFAMKLISKQKILEAAEATECVYEQTGNDGYNSYVSRLYNKKFSLGTELYYTMAEKVVPNFQQFKDCLKIGKYKAGLDADYEFIKNKINYKEDGTDDTKNGTGIIDDDKDNNDKVEDPLYCKRDEDCTIQNTSCNNCSCPKAISNSNWQKLNCQPNSTGMQCQLWCEPKSVKCVNNQCILTPIESKKLDYNVDEPADVTRGKASSGNSGSMDKPIDQIEPNKEPIFYTQ